MPTLNAADLNQFTGTTNYYRHWLNRAILYTDGAKHVAEHGEAYWLLDLIVSHQHQVKDKRFQAWTLAVNDDNSAKVICKDGNGNHLLTQSIPFTDFPLKSIELWFYDDVILLPSEY